MWLRLIKNDIKEYTYTKWWLFIIVTLVSMLFTMLYLMNFTRLMNLNLVSGEITFADMFVFIFQGMKKYDPSSKEIFNIEDNFLFFNLLLAFMIGHFASKSSARYVSRTLLRCHSIIRWWNCKCLWSMINVFIFYIFIAFGIGIGGILYKLFNASNKVDLFSYKINIELINRQFNCRIKSIDQAYFYKGVLLLIVASICISLMQLIVSYCINAILGYVSVICMLGFSAYYTSEILPGNWLMFGRYNEIIEGGISIIIPMVYAIIYIFVMYLIGYISLKHKDFM